MQELKAVVSSVLVMEDTSAKPLPPLLVVTSQDIDVRDETNRMQAEANEPLELVTLHSNRSNATIHIGTRLSPEYKKTLKQLLIEHKDMFAWSHENMPGIDNVITEHRLCVDPTMKKV